MDHLFFKDVTRPDPSLQCQPSSTADSSCEEAMADNDEPPDEPKTVVKPSFPKFQKISYTQPKKQSLLTQTIHSSGSEDMNDEDDIFSGSNRAHSSASTWSRGSAASTVDLTSDGQTSPARTNTPSPPLPPLKYLEHIPVFNQNLFNGPPSTVGPHESIDPLHKVVSKITPAPSNNEAVEAFMRRRRCITFACGKKDETKPEDLQQFENSKPDQAPVKKTSALQFVCPTRSATDAPTKPHVRLASPPPPQRRSALMPGVTARSHRGSDSTVRNDSSPRSVRKVPSATRSQSLGSSSALGHIGTADVSRFYEFASSGDEADEWTQEATCHRSRLTIDDTLKIENDLRKLGKEAEDEEAEEDEDEDEDENEDSDRDVDDDDDDNDSIGIVDSTGYVSDEGFASDDEHGFAGSEEDSDAGSDYQFWVPGNPTPGKLHGNIRPRSRRSNSGSSVASFSSTRVFPSRTPKAMKHKKSHPVDIRPRTPELPDSTDFVCGTLDEDRPLEQAYMSCLEQKRAAKHHPVPQDIDPTFPTSDPDMDEEDEDLDESALYIEDSDHHVFIHGHPDSHSEAEERSFRGVMTLKRSPNHSPRRMLSPPPNKRILHRSPPPTKRTIHRSPPPPRRMFGGQSPKRARSPPPTRQLRAPPSTRHISFAPSHYPELEATPANLAERPPWDNRVTSSVPRNGPFRIQRPPMHSASEDNDDGAEDATPTEAMFTRGAIDIVKGLEKKRQRRREKAAEKRCQMRGKGKEKKHFVLPGKGAERMKEMGLELAALRKKRPVGNLGAGEVQHILSY